LVCKIYENANNSLIIYINHVGNYIVNKVNSNGEDLIEIDLKKDYYYPTEQYWQERINSMIADGHISENIPLPEKPETIYIDYEDILSYYNNSTSPEDNEENNWLLDYMLKSKRYEVINIPKEITA
jgi:hypothetical protein